MTSAPISVVIPVRNRAALLEQALDSVRAQTLPPAEILVVDDGSTDACAETAERMGAQVLRLGGQGVSTARNVGILAATQPWIGFLDSDDLWEPSKLERTLHGLEAAGESASLAFTDFSVFSDLLTSPNPQSIHPAVLRTEAMNELMDIDPHFLDMRSAYAGVMRTPVEAGVWRCTPESLQCALTRYGGFLLTSSLVLRRDLFLQAGLFDPSLEVSQDWDIFLRLSMVADPIVIEEPLVRYRLHATNNSGNFTRSAIYLTTLVNNAAVRRASYPPGFPEYWAQELPRRLNTAIRLGLRYGQFGAAKQTLLRRMQREVSPEVLAWFTLAMLADSPMGHGAFRMLGRLKRSWRRG